MTKVFGERVFRQRNQTCGGKGVCLNFATIAEMQFLFLLAISHLSALNKLYCFTLLLVF